MAWPRNSLRRLEGDYGVRSAKWQAFERWTKDFPSLKDDPPATLELWKRILVFGVAFGTADRMIESGRIPAPVLESSTNTWASGYFYGGMQRRLVQRLRLQLRLLLPGRPRVLLQRRRRRLLGRRRWRRRWRRRRFLVTR